MNSYDPNRPSYYDREGKVYNYHDEGYSDDYNTRQSHGVAAQRRNIVIGVVLAFALLILVPAIVIFVSKQNPPSDAPQAVQQPATAAQVAQKLGCTGFKTGDVGGSGMVVSAGTCTKNDVKYAIDTFASKDVRDAWLKEAEKLGVNPKWESATSVTYKSVSSLCQKQSL